MLSRRSAQPQDGRATRSIKALALVLAIVAHLDAQASEASPWSNGPHVAARLIDGGDAGAGLWRAGVEMRLDPGFITYWRSAGEAGVPPTFDFSASSNLKHAQVSYPAPRLINEDGTVAYGYEAGVVFPVTVEPLTASAPVELDLAFGYAVCARLCVPGRAHLRITLDGSPSNDGAAVDSALLRVPSRRSLGGPDPLRIDSILPDGAQTFRVDATTPGGQGTLFVEAPEPWYVSASAGRTTGEGHLAFTLTAPDHPPGRTWPADPVWLTLVAPSGAIEVPVRLDATALKP